ncbi:ABC-type transport system, permease component [Halalkaliarchaeum desulfuricum]|uniref:ABC-type transport system, permease component n=1 Tax=Halalkaliarchaeum desulfuricum TaxID=2055893 RepID=A0A343TL23_9EURY|nr:ABC transporter permease [Halalkaliarchaeum desulfuricum]AUX09795.1 ABC-type transport system, permease component [Halalkaliarchaeum desulfuricum]
MNRESIERLLDRLVDTSGTERIAISLAALVFASLVGGVLVFVSGAVATCRIPAFTIAGVEFCYNPVEVYAMLVYGAFGTPVNIGLTLQETTLLLFTGLSVAVAFRAGLFNIGTQGQMVVGALASALTVIWLAPYVPENLIGALLLVPLSVVVGAAGGGFYGAIPGAMKAYADAHEVITTIMLNFVAFGITFYLVRNHVGDPTVDAVQTVAVPDFVRLSPTIGGTRFSLIALVSGLVVAIGVYLLYKRTVIGYELRTSGLAPDAAEYGGVNAEQNIVTSMTLSGALGGIGGSMYVLMILYRFQTEMPPLGFDGIAVSILAGNNPLGVIPAAVLFGALKAGALQIDFALGVPNELIEVLRGLIILFVAMPEFFRMLGKRAGYGTGGTEAAVTDGGETDG